MRASNRLLPAGSFTHADHGASYLPHQTPENACEVAAQVKGNVDLRGLPFWLVLL